MGNHLSKLPNELQDIILMAAFWDDELGFHNFAHLYRVNKAVAQRIDFFIFRKLGYGFDHRYSHGEHSRRIHCFFEMLAIRPIRELSFYSTVRTVVINRRKRSADQVLERGVLEFATTMLTNCRYLTTLEIGLKVHLDHCITTLSIPSLTSLHLHLCYTSLEQKSNPLEPILNLPLLCTVKQLVVTANYVCHMGVYMQEGEKTLGHYSDNLRSLERVFLNFPPSHCSTLGSVVFDRYGSLFDQLDAVVVALPANNQLLNMSYFLLSCSKTSVAMDKANKLIFAETTSPDDRFKPYLHLTHLSNIRQAFKRGRGTLSAVSTRTESERRSVKDILTIWQVVDDILTARDST
ncbi:hypothetical protein DL96DRAFT_1715621 [Flagelloscypha sp. PMI_526]|nr:hypothetical protein DL96DRAFT_1715621 [Flagelloscypha sp. PMI_526]